jgi:hypothetical protein
MSLALKDQIFALIANVSLQRKPPAPLSDPKSSMGHQCPVIRGPYAPLHLKDLRE